MNVLQKASPQLARLQRRRHGTARRPGAHLDRLPIGLDLSGISVAEGLRAVLASAIFLALNQWIGSTPLTIAATGALITCFCDVGGTLRQRLPMLLCFTILGAATWACFGMLRAVGVGLTIPLAGAAVFLFSMARVWGLRAQTIGNILIVVLALAIDAPLRPGEAAVFFASFLVGGLWASLLTLVIWRIQPDRPATEAVEGVWLDLASLAQDMRGLALDRMTRPADWEGHARSHRRAVRTRIEDTRVIVSSSLRARGLLSGRGTQALLLLEVGDQLFGELIIMSELLEAAKDAGFRSQAAHLLRRMRPLLVLIGSGRAADAPRLNRSIDRIAAEDAGPGLDGLRRVIVDRLRVAARILEGEAQPVQRAATVQQVGGVWSRRVWGPLRDELTWTSAILRHAVRATVLTVPAIAITLVWWTPYAHWLTITVALTMQPFFAATWQRALERIGGTLLGAAIGSALAFFPQTPIVTAALMLPISILGFSVRQVSYGAYVACLTPLIVLLFDIVEPGHSAWLVAGMRALYTILGGVLAVAACMVLWPSWEPNRVKRELRQTLLAYAKLAAAVLGDACVSRAEATEVARRSAGLANSNLEAALSRALQEPGQGRRVELDKIIAADAILRRLGAALLATPHDPTVTEILGGPGRTAWQDWVSAAFTALADERPLPPVAPEAPADSTLQRVRRGVEVLSDDLLGPSLAGRPAPVA